MMKTSLLLSYAAVALLAISGAAAANERYREVSPVMVSDRLTQPWVTQLQNGRAGVRGATRVRVPVEMQQNRMGAAPMAPRAVIVVKPSRQPLFGPSVINVDRAPQNVNYQRAERPAATRLAPQFLPQEVAYNGKEKPGTIVIDTEDRFLYLVGKDGKARRYGVGVGKPGFEWAGAHKITRKAEWPGWTPPKEMIAREAKRGHILPAHMDGGEANPLGARAMYLGSTEYRIHGTNAPWTIGYAVSSGCIRMRNEDVVDLYERVKVGTNVIVK